MITKRHLLFAVGAGVILALAGFASAGPFGRGAAIAGQDAHNANQTLPFGEVNWDRGFIKVSAIGLPPFGSTGAVSAQDVARQNAVSLAQKRLLGVLLDLNTAKGKLRDQVASNPALKERLRTLVSAATVSGKSYSDGSVEITLTVPVDGSAGIKDFLRSL